MILDYDQLVKKHRINASGVLHLGASEGQEIPTYLKYGYKMAFVEALPNVYGRLVENAKGHDAICYHACVSDKSGESVDFNIANNDGQSSSILQFGTHSKEHPSVKFIGKIRMITKRVDELVDSIERYDLLVMDLQGAELMALRGIGEKLNGFRYIYTEVNERELYKGCALMGEIDGYLRWFGFRRVETSITRWGWGDALYIKDESFVPQEGNHAMHLFQPMHEVRYPAHNAKDFEQWFMENYVPAEGTREYIPVMWTAWQLKNDRNPKEVGRLQQYLDSLDPRKKYFTVVQHDDGIKLKLPYDCKVFGMGKESDYPLPLICEPHNHKFNVEHRDIFCSYVGNDTHPIRRKIRAHAGWYVSRNHHEPEKFCNILARSVFTLCPRGYGINSFRIMEALQYGSIPVYISDRFIFPHHVDFETYGVVINSSSIDSIDSVLRSVSSDDIAKKQSVIPDVFDRYYTYQSNMKLICENI